MSDLAFMMLIFFGSFFAASLITLLFPAPFARFAEWMFNRIHGRR